MPAIKPGTPITVYEDPATEFRPLAHGTVIRRLFETGQFEGRTIAHYEVRVRGLGVVGFNVKEPAE